MKNIYTIGILCLSILCSLSASALNTTIQHTCEGLDNGAIYINMILPAVNEPFTYTLIGPAVSNTDAGPQIDGDEPVFENLTAGDYLLVVTDKDGCQGVEEIEIEIGAHVDCCELLLDATLTPSTSPTANDGSINLTLTLAQGTADAPPYTFQWQGPNNYMSNTEDISGLELGEYCVWVYDRLGCVANLCIEVEAKQCVADWIELEVFGYATTHTDNDDGLIYVKEITSRNITHEWSGPSTVVEEDFYWNAGTDYNIVKNLSVGLYCLTVTDIDYGCTEERCIYIGDGCSIYDDFLVTYITPEIRPETPVNLGYLSTVFQEKIEGTIPSGFNIGGPYILYMQDTGTPWISTSEGFPAGIYCVKRSLMRYGLVIPYGPNTPTSEVCPEMAIGTCFEVPFEPNPCETRKIEADIVHNCMNGFLPSGGSITLQLSTDEYGWVPPLTYQWDWWNSTNPQITNLFSGTYCVSVSDSEGCSATKCFEVGDNKMAVSTHIIPHCPNYPGSIEVEVSGDFTQPLTYSWTTLNQWGFPGTYTVGDRVKYNLIGGSTKYCVQVEDAEGCIFTKCGLTVPTAEITTGTSIDGDCYEITYCGQNNVVDVTQKGFSLERIPSTCDSWVYCNGENTGNIQWGTEVDSWYVITNNKATNFWGVPAEGCELPFECMGCKQWIECSDGGHVAVEGGDSFQIEAYDFNFLQEDCGVDETGKKKICGDCELKFKCPATDEDITDYVIDHYDRHNQLHLLQDDAMALKVYYIDENTDNSCRALIKCFNRHGFKPNSSIETIDIEMEKEVDCGFPGLAPPIAIGGHLTPSQDLSYYTINHYIGLTILNYYDQFYQPVWNTVFEGTGIEVAQDLSLDAVGNALTVGYFTQTLEDSRGGTYTAKGDKDAFLVKHNSLGEEIWTMQIGGMGSEIANGIDIDNSGNIVVTGSFDDQIAFDGHGIVSESQSMFLAKFSPNGQFLWAKSGGGLGEDAGLAISTDLEDNIFVAGYYEGSANFGGHTFSDSGDDTPELFIAKYDEDGNLLWAKNAVSSNFDMSRVEIVSTLSSGVAVFGGATGDLTFDNGTTIQGNSNDPELFLAYYDAIGNLSWSKQLGNTPEKIYAGGIDIETNGHIIINGTFEGTANFENTNLQSAGEKDVFIAQFTTTGNLLGAESEGGPLSEYGAAITAVKGANHIAYTGSFYGTPILEGIQLQGETDKSKNYVVGFGTSSTKQSLNFDESMPTHLKRIYPNPFQKGFAVEIFAPQEENATIRIYDVQGKQIFQKNYDLVKGYNSQSIQLENVSNGLYLLEVMYADGRSVTKKINRVDE